MTAPASRFAPDWDDLRDLVRARGGEVGHDIHLLDTTGSTNDEAKRAAKSGAPHGSVWIAEEQTAGRGRQGRRWLGTPGESILLSVLLRVECTLARLPPLALVAGLAARDAIAPHTERVPGIKWPNDVVFRAPDGGLLKVAGVLVEAQIQGTRVEGIVVGVGINVHTRSETLPAEIRERATSVAVQAREDHAPDRATIVADLLAGLDRELPLAAARGLGFVHARLEAACVLRGERVRSDVAEAAEGTCEGIDVEGRLLVRRADGILDRWVAGEVNLLRRGGAD
jgi:BirA family transcriptional regulator, biotin operon repressor / biotin---[acetyl-CoA-carboxylase] ligase